MKNPVFILSLFDTGYYAARQLLRVGCPIIGFDYQITNPGFFSRYLIAHFCPNPISNGDDLLQFIIQKASLYKEKPILIAASEPFVHFVGKYESFLSENFLFLYIKKTAANEFLDKEKQMECASKNGLNISPIYKKNPYSSIRPDLKSSFILKAANQIQWKANIKEKAFIVNNETELAQSIKILEQKKVGFICQQIIPGSISNNYEYNALMLNDEIIHSHVIQKLHQYPFGFGSACAVKVVENKEVTALGSRFVTNNKLEGFSNTEFKYNPLSGKYYFIETNIRVWQQIELSTIIGDNILLRYYKFLTEGVIDEKKALKTGKVWIDLPSILVLYVKHKKESGITLMKLLKLLFSSNNFGLLSIRDIKPFIKTALLK